MVRTLCFLLIFLQTRVEFYFLLTGEATDAAGLGGGGDCCTEQVEKNQTWKMESEHPIYQNESHVLKLNLSFHIYRMGATTTTLHAVGQGQ